MIKALVLIFSCACVAIVLSVVAAALLLWERGLLTEHHLKEVRLVFSTTAPKEETGPEENSPSQQVSQDEVLQTRASKFLDFSKRESELTALKNMVADQRQELESQQEVFRAQRKSFEEELQGLNASLTAASTEQARGVLMALPSKDAVEKLRVLPLADNVLLLKGMPDKVIAKILQEFTGTPELVKRGQEIFEALKSGEPNRKLIDETLQKARSNEPVSRRGG